MEQAMNATVLRQTSRRRVLRCVYNRAEPVTEREIAGELSLEPATVADGLTELMEAGLVFRSGEGYALEARARVAVGITIQWGEARLLAIDMRAGELGYREMKMTFAHTPEYYEGLARELEKFLDDFHLERGRLLGVGITLPGIIDQSAGKLVMAPTLELWDVPLEEIYRYFSRYPVFIENDANASGYAEWWTEKGRSNMVYLSLERGVGGAIFWGDEQYTGDHGRSGEFGHLCVVPNGIPCYCGRRGCLGAYSSGRAVVARCAEALERGEAPGLAALGGAERLAMAEILEAQAAGDAAVKGIVERAVYMLGVAAANIINFACPSMMLIEGKLFQLPGNRELLLKTVRRNLCNVVRSDTEFVFAAPDSLSGARGAAAMAICKDLETYNQTS